jgi:3-dehydroquinate synthase
MGLDRTSCVIAFGGGVIGDLAGFFAGTFMRGIKLVQAPTTLLAMADSSIGGKTAITTALAKNIAGTFKQPEFVWINPKFLSTLPQREIKNGMAEILKYAFTFDTKFYDYLVGVFQKGINTTQNFEHIIYKCCSYKASVVVKDEKDTKGIREILNFGHTLAHAIETQTKYKKFLHGEAVAIGALFAAGLSRVLGLCKIEVFDQVKVLLSSADLIFPTKGLNASDLVRLMKKDKKTVDGKIKFVLLKGLGLAVCGYSVADKKIETELKKFLKETDK